MSDSRRALRDFYKLAAENAPGSKDKPEAETSSPTAGPEGSELSDDPDDEKLTQLDELDAEGANVQEFVTKLVKEQSLPEFAQTAAQIRRERAALASAQQELVNDNYKRLIHAAETLEYLSAQGDLAKVDSMAAPINELAEFAAKMASQRNTAKTT